jgi:hypothetical protein
MNVNLKEKIAEIYARKEPERRRPDGASRINQEELFSMHHLKIGQTLSRGRLITP